MQLKKFYNERTVLVTGGLGFIGSYLVRELVDLGAQVTILDNASASSKDLPLELDPRIKIIEKSITDPLACLQATHNQTTVFHCAAFTSVSRSFENPSMCHQINVEGTFNLLEASRLQSVERFIFASTAAVYGNYDEPCCESYMPQPQSPYGYSKYVCELYCRQYAQLYGLSTVSLRYFNVIGKRPGNITHHDVLSCFRQSLESKNPIYIYGDGKQTRDFISIENVAQKTLFMGMQDPQILNGDCYNIATGKSLSLLELFYQLKQDFPDYAYDPIFKPPRQGDTRHSKADCSKYLNLEKSVTTL